MPTITPQSPAAGADRLTELRILLSIDFGLDDVGPDEDLLESGLLDSLAIVELVVALEDSFEIRIADDDMTAANFSTIDSIAGLVARVRP